MEEEYFKFTHHGFCIYEELYHLKEVKNFMGVYEVTFISVATLKNLIDYYNNDDKLDCFKIIWSKYR